MDYPNILGLSTPPPGSWAPVPRNNGRDSYTIKSMSYVQLYHAVIVLLTWGAGC